MATVEELVISLLYKSQQVEQKLEAVDRQLDELRQSNASVQQALDKTASSAQKAGDAAKKAGDKAKQAGDGFKEEAGAARKAGDEAEKAGRKAAGAASLIDKANAKLAKTWTKAAIGYLTAFTAAGAVIGFFKDAVAGALDSAMAVDKLSEATGESRKEIYALGEAFESLGIAQEKAYGFLEKWDESRVAAQTGRTGQMENAARQVGIRTREKDGSLRSGSDVLVEMGRKAVSDSGGDKGLAAKRLQALGLEAEAAKAAVNATQELIDAKRQSNSVSEEQLAKAVETAQRFKDLGKGVDGLKTSLGQGLLPILEYVVDGIQGVVQFCRDLNGGFEEASGGVSILQGALEIITAPLNIVIGLVESLLQGLGGVSNWAATGGQVVYGFFSLMQSVWNACIMVVNGLIASLEGLVNAVMQVGHAIGQVAKFAADPLNHKVEAYKPIEFGRIKAFGSGGGKGSAGPASWRTSAGRGPIRGSYGLGGGSGGGRAGGGRSAGRRGGGGGRGSGGSAGKEEPVYHSRFQGTADPKKLGIEPVKPRLAEDPAKAASREAKRGNGTGSGDVGRSSRRTTGEDSRQAAPSGATPVTIKQSEPLRVREVGRIPVARIERSSTAQTRVERSQVINNRTVERLRDGGSAPPSSLTPVAVAIRQSVPLRVQADDGKAPAERVEKTLLERSTVERSTAVSERTVERLKPVLAPNQPAQERRDAQKAAAPVKPTVIRVPVSGQSMPAQNRSNPERYRPGWMADRDGLPQRTASQRRVDAALARPAAVPGKAAPPSVRQVGPLRIRLDGPLPTNRLEKTHSEKSSVERSSVTNNRIVERMMPFYTGAKAVASQAARTFHISNSISVDARGNTNARQVASKTADAVNMVMRRQAGAMV